MDHPRKPAGYHSQIRPGTTFAVLLSMHLDHADGPARTKVFQWFPAGTGPAPWTQAAAADYYET
jgi:hypothetical protein